MRYLTYGEMHKRAMAVGLVMSRNRADLTIALRWRDPTWGRREWPNLLFDQADEIIRSIELDLKAASAPDISRRATNTPFRSRS